MQHPVKITYAQYEKYLKADNMIRTTAICKVSDEVEVVVERDVILDNPTLTLEVSVPRISPPASPVPRNSLAPVTRQLYVDHKGSLFLLGEERTELSSDPASTKWICSGQSSCSLSGTYIASFGCHSRLPGDITGARLDGKTLWPVHHLLSC